jgi:hypothetical protein
MRTGGDVAKRREWFGVKTLYRVAPEGRPLGKDRFYSASMTLIEERVIVVRARSADEAARMGRREAAQYARGHRRNPYGQRVRVRFMGYIYVYDIDQPVREGIEVFSTTEVMSRAVPDRAVIRRQIGRPESERAYRSRRNVLNLVFAGTAPGVKPTRSERAFRRDLDARIGRRRDA